jgi:hypothetical protein
VARPTKSLEERVRARSFLARRHGGLLAAPLTTSDPELAEIQAAWKAAETDRERRLCALEFEQKVLAARSGKRVGGLRSRGSHAPADFFPRNFTHTKGPAAGSPFKLESWQRSFVDDLYRRDERGQRIFKRAILGIPRGNGKSPLAAGLGLYELLTREDEPDIICAAAARDQAGVVFEYARAFAESSPIADQLVIGRREIARAETRGVLRTISADGYVAHGINPSAAIIDEAHAFTTAKQRELMEAIDTAIHKRPDAFWLMITTAGHDRASLLGKLFADVLEQLEPEHPAPGLTTASLRSPPLVRRLVYPCGYWPVRASPDDGHVRGADRQDLRTPAPRLNRPRQDGPRGVWARCCHRGGSRRRAPVTRKPRLSGAFLSIGAPRFELGTSSPPD